MRPSADLAWRPSSSLLLLLLAAVQPMRKAADAEKDVSQWQRPPPLSSIYFVKPPKTNTLFSTIVLTYACGPIHYELSLIHI